MLRTLAPRQAALGYPRAAHAGRLARKHRGWARLAGAARVVRFWLARSRQRRALATLDDHLLRDIGLTRDAARRECAQPFWKP